MKTKAYFIIYILSIFLLSCDKKVIAFNSLDANLMKLSHPKTVLIKNKNTYIYDLNVIGPYIALWDNKSDTVMQIIYKDSINKNVTSIYKKFGENNLWNPKVTKEVKDKNINSFFVIDNNMNIKQIHIKKDSVKIQEFNKFNTPELSSNYNITKKELYAVPSYDINIASPFYFYNNDDGFFRVDPDKHISSILPFAGVAYTCNLCVNEKMNTAVSAYRFTNAVSFYNLEGILSNTFILGKTIFSPILKKNKKEINITSSTKYFIHIYGTLQYVYCLYSGSNDFSSHSRILVFDWTGKYIKSWISDRALRVIAIDENDKHMFAISSDNEGKQSVLKYTLI